MSTPLTQENERDIQNRRPPPAPPPQEPQASELAVGVRQRIGEVRQSGGGPPAVANECRRLLGQAHGVTHQAVLLALQDLTPEERDALEGRGIQNQAPGGANAAANGPGHAAPGPHGQNAAPAANAAGAGNAAGGNHAAPAANAAGAGNAAGGNHAAPAANAAGAGNAAGGNHAAPGANAAGGANAPNGANAAGGNHAPHGANAAGGADAAGGGHAVAAGGGENENHAGPAAEVSPAEGRALIQDELAQHERWAVLSSNDRGARARELFRGMDHDVLVGLRGGAEQVGVGLLVQTLARRVPIPGVGNIISGGMSALYLFRGGGRQLVGEIGEAGGAAFNDIIHGHFSWLTVANLVSTIKSVLELVGHVANVISGLCYGFAAIAAIGTLLSIVCPPLAACASAIPVLLDFGQAAGAVGSICLSIASMLSILPPVFRAIHIIYSNDDPFRLMAQESKFHEEAQGAIANYAAMGANRAISGKGPISEIRENATNLRNSFSGSSSTAPAQSPAADAGGGGAHGGGTAPAGGGHGAPQHETAPAGNQGPGPAAGSDATAPAGGGGQSTEPPLGTHRDRMDTLGVREFQQDIAGAGSQTERSGYAREFAGSYFRGEGYGRSETAHEMREHQEAIREAQGERAQADREAQQAQRDVQAAQAQRDAAMTEAIRNGDRQVISDPEHGPNAAELAEMQARDPSRVGDVEGAQARRDAALHESHEAEQRAAGLQAEGDGSSHQSNRERLGQQQARLQAAERNLAQAEDNVAAANRQLQQAQAQRDAGMTEAIRNGDRQPISDPEHGPNAEEVARMQAQDPTRGVAAAQAQRDAAAAQLQEAQRQVREAQHGVTEGTEGMEHSGTALNAGHGWSGPAGDAGGAAIGQLVHKPAEEREQARERHEQQELNHVAGEVAGERGGGDRPAQHGGEQRAQLPPPPGSLQQVDAMDQEIQQLAARLPQQRATTQEARTLQRDAQQGAQALGGLQQGVQQQVQQRQQQGQTEHQRIQAQNQQAEGQANQAGGQSQGGMQNAASQLGPIAGMARSADGLAQRIPDNRWVNVSSVKNNIHEFRTGIDQITGAGPEGNQMTQQARQGMTVRNQALSQAQNARQQATGSAGQLQQRIQSDQQRTQQVAGEAQGAMQQGQMEERTTEQQLLQKRREREALWGELLGWAAGHRQLRLAAMARASEEHH